MASPPDTSSPTRDIGPLWRQRHGRPVRKLGLRLGGSCPNRDGTLGRGGCLFCAEGSLTPPPPLHLQVETGLQRLGQEVGVLAYLQDFSVTHRDAAALDRLLHELHAIPRLVGIALGTRPDCLPPAILDVLQDHAVRIDLLVELGLQTAHQPTLDFNRRLHSLATFTGAVAALGGRGLRCCAHVILGLPTPGADGQLISEPAAHAVQTARYLGELGVAAVKIHNCHVLAGTALADLFRTGAFAPVDLEGYLERLIPFLEHLPPTVEIHRLVGEASPPALLAPAFTGEKQRTLARIRAALQERQTFQGRSWLGARSP